MRFKQDDGGIHPADSAVANYETSIAMMALVAANKDGRYDGEIKAAKAFVQGLQWDDGEGKASSDPAYGGAGYAPSFHHWPSLRALLSFAA
jgi:squalene-hopene/tetraprenyl-beta-curcumene cyclase